MSTRELLGNPNRMLRSNSAGLASHSGGVAVFLAAWRGLVSSLRQGLKGFIITCSTMFSIQDENFITLRNFPKLFHVRSSQKAIKRMLFNYLRLFVCLSCFVYRSSRRALNFPAYSAIITCVESWPLMASK